MTHEVFICYASPDKPVAEAVCATLESRHIRCWIAPRDVLPGTQWAEAIVDALDRSRVVVLVLSSSSNSSPQVIREVGRTASNNIPIIPLRIDDVPPSKAMEFFVSSHHWLDAQTPPLEKHLQRLADTVQQLLTQEVEKGVEIAGEKETKCAYHPEREVVGACVDCGRLVCAECKVELGGKIYCNSCVDKIAVGGPTPPPQAEEKVTYNIALRWTSGGIAGFFILSVIAGLQYFAESGLVSELIVDLFSIIIAIAYLVMAFKPQWVRAQFRIKLEKGSIFAAALGVLFAIGLIILAFGPEPPGGWWNY